MLDLILENAKIVDGTGNPWFKGDVGVERDRITMVGDLTGAAARRKIKVDGRVLAPGFIDLHSHSDMTLHVYPRAESMVSQGITTQLGGNCGSSPFPVAPENFETLKGYTSFIETGKPWDWKDAAGYAAYLETLPLAFNFALQVGHGAVRIAIMGFENREPSSQELERMEKLVAQAMEDGVFGFSTGLIYVPGGYSKTDEIVALAKVAARYGGFYSSHIRGEGATLLEAVEEALTVGKQAGLPVQLSHHKASGKPNWGKVHTSLGMIDQARIGGQDVLADQYPYIAGSTTLSAIMPKWALEGGIEAMRARLADPESYSRIKNEIAGAAPGTGGAEFSVESIMISRVPEGPNRRFEGLMLPEIGKQREEDAIDSALYLLSSESWRIQMIIFSMDETDVRTVMRHPAVAVATDGSGINPSFGGKPHPRTYSTFPRVLAKYVREEKVLSLEEAIRKMTSLPAQRLRRFDLGLVQPGARADLVILDPDKVEDRSTFQEPHQFCEGIDYVIINGLVVRENGADTGAKAGRVLRRGKP